MKALLKRLSPAFQQSLIYALALAGAKGVSLLLIPVFTHYLSPSDYGRLDILQTLADVLSIVIGLGLADTLFRFCSQDSTENNKKIAAQLYAMAWIIAFISFIITQSAQPYITQALPGQVSETQTRLILASLSLSGTILVPMAWLRFQGKAPLFLCGSLGQTFLQACLGSFFLYLGFGVSGLLVAGFIACLTLCIFLGYLQLKDTGISFSLTAFSKFSLYGGPLIFAGFAGFILGSFDRWVLADIVGPAVMAQYALAAKFGLITAVLIQPFDMWWHAKRFHIFHQFGPKRCAYYASIGVMIACAATLIVSSLAPFLITILTPPSYHTSIQYVPWLVILAALHNLTQTLGFGIYTQTTTKWPALIDASAALIALIGYFSLIPLYFIPGAIGATCLALGLRFIVTLILAQRLCFIPYETAKLVFLGAFTITASLWISFALSGFNQIMTGVLALISLGILGFFFNFLPKVKILQLVKP